MLHPSLPSIGSACKSAMNFKHSEHVSLLTWMLIARQSGMSPVALSGCIARMGCRSCKRLQRYANRCISAWHAAYCRGTHWSLPLSVIRLNPSISHSFLASLVHIPQSSWQLGLSTVFQPLAATFNGSSGHPIKTATVDKDSDVWPNPGLKIGM